MATALLSGKIIMEAIQNLGSEEAYKIYNKFRNVDFATNADIIRVDETDFVQTISKDDPSDKFIYRLLYIIQFDSIFIQLFYG